MIIALCVENMSIRPESYKIVLIVFYCFPGLWTISENKDTCSLCVSCQCTFWPLGLHG